MRTHNQSRIEAMPEAEESWTAHVADTIANSLLLQTDSWFMGANTPGKKCTAGAMLFVMRPIVSTYRRLIKAAA